MSLNSKLATSQPGLVDRSGAISSTRIRKLHAWLDAAGVAILAAAILWTFISVRHEAGEPLPVAALLGASAAVFTATRLSGKGRWLAPLVVVSAAVLLFALEPQDTLNPAPLNGPLRYVNARAAFFAQAVAASLVLAAIWRRGPLKIAAVALALALSIVPFASRSAAGTVSSTLILVVALAGPLARRTRLVIAASALAFLATLATTTVLGATYQKTKVRQGGDRRVQTSIEARRALWHDGFTLMRDNPGTGVGARRFREVSELARADPDKRWAHHAFLQQGAEAGVTGYALLALLFFWGFARLWVSPSQANSAAIGAAALASLGMHACVDYVLHFALVPIAGAAVLAATSGTDVRATKPAETSF